ncbi:hypothetical protein AK830_g189 [Neonectria ditissima]|uniref:Uncharacterized protein n=1 Tax=Neonectria ditissima TaxID=78410 RepID=A0A0P7BHA7_9HYPO|nr:hypothetical protein AK830_g189 [Neonectria ditissima]
MAAPDESFSPILPAYYGEQRSTKAHDEGLDWEQHKQYPPVYHASTTPGNYGTADHPHQQQPQYYRPSTTQPQANLVPDQQPGQQWQPTILKSLPWTGLFGLFICLSSVAATVAVLLSANGESTDSWPNEEWPIQLAVVLAIIIAIGNAGLTMAYNEGVTLSWWIKMLKGGSLADSHRYWEHGSSAWQSIVGIRHVNKISVVSILLLLLIVDGPLLQRAAGFTTVTETEQATFTAGLSADQLSQSTAYYMTRAHAVNTLAPNFSRVVQEYSGRKPVTLDLAGCNGTCSGTLVAAGFDIGCTRDTAPYDLDVAPGDTASIGAISVLSDGIVAPGVIDVSTVYKAMEGEKGHLIRTNCTLHSAQVGYPFKFVNGTVTLGGSISSVDAIVNNTVALLYPMNETSGLGKWPSLLGGIAYAAGNIYNSEIELYQSGTLALQGTGPMQYTYMNSSDEYLGTWNMTWTDPTPSVLEAIRELTFRTAISFSNSSSEQTVYGTQLRTTTRYVLHMEFLAGTLVIVVVAAVAVGCLFHGFWLLGRRVSMSPLEIAAAFQAPITAGADSNADAAQLASQVGSREAKYGALQSYEGGQMLAITSPSVVSWPAMNRSNGR